MTSTASAPNGAARTAPPPVVPLKGAQLALGTLALSLATFMNVLDSSIANVAIPAISGDVGVSPSQGTWVITSFGVANAISVPLTGWLTQRFGAVRLFTMSVLLFVLTSWLCGFASSLEMLVLFRVLQGAVAGPMIPLSQTLLLSSYPPSKAGTALALWGVTTLVAPVVGPLLGGWITDNISWPWIFYINVPVGLLSALMTWSIYRHRETPTRKLPIDTVGLSLLVLWVGALQLMLDKGKELDWFASGEIIAFTVIAVVAFAVFVVWELTDAHPVVDLRLFKRRNFAAGSMALSIAYGVFFGNVVLLPLWLQQWMGYTSTAAGLALAPVGLLAIVLTPLVGRKVGVWDPRKMATGAFIVFALVLWMRSQFTVETDFRHILVPTLIQGAAMAFFFIPLTTITLSGLTPDRIPARRPVQLRAHHGRCHGHVDRHHAVGKPRRHAPRAPDGAAGAGPGRVRHHRAAAAGGGHERRAGLCPDQPPDRPAGLHARGGRHLPGLVLPVPEPDRADLVHAAAQGPRRGRCGRRRGCALSRSPTAHREAETAKAHRG